MRSCRQAVSRFKQANFLVFTRVSFLQSIEFPLPYLHSCSGPSLSMRLWETSSVCRDLDSAWQVRSSNTWVRFQFSPKNIQQKLPEDAVKVAPFLLLYYSGERSWVFSRNFSFSLPHMCEQDGNHQMDLC